MTKFVKLPWKFFIDHKERDLDTPVVVKATATHAVCDLNDPAMDELLSDAKHYADSAGYMESHLFGLCMSARATKRAILKARKDN